MAPPVLPVDDHVYVIAPPSGSTDPLAAHVLVAPAARETGVQLMAGVLGAWLAAVNVMVTGVESADCALASSLAIAVTDTVPAEPSEYVVTEPVDGPVRPVDDQAYATAPPSGSLEPLAVQVMFCPAPVEVGEQITVGAVGARLANVTKIWLDDGDLLPLGSIPLAVTVMVSTELEEYVAVDPLALMRPELDQL